MRGTIDWRQCDVCKKQARQEGILCSFEGWYHLEENVAGGFGLRTKEADVCSLECLKKFAEEKEKTAAEAATHEDPFQAAARFQAEHRADAKGGE